MAEPLLTLDDVAARLQVSRKTVNRWVGRHELRVVYLARRMPRVTERELAAFIGARRRVA